MSKRIAKEKITRFVNKWHNKGKEKQDTHSFWEELVEIILGVEHGRDIIDTEKPVPATAIVVEDGNRIKFIDCYIKPSKCIVEQKSFGISLSDKTASYKDEQGIIHVYDAREQAKIYYNRLNQSEQGRYYIACNFEEFSIYDNNHKEKAPVTFSLKDLYHHRNFLYRVLSGEASVGQQDKDAIQDATAKTASGIINKLYKLLLDQYKSKEQTSEVLHQLNVFCVRVVFCLYADDAELFEDRQFNNFLRSFSAKKLEEKFKWLFLALDQKEEQRAPSLDKEIKAFPHVNGGLFHDIVETPRISEDIRNLLLNSVEDLHMPGKDDIPFSWSEISPTNFGCIFESTLDANTRHKNGMHYTSPTNIHRVIDPLFLDDLSAELETIIEMPYEENEEKRQKDSALLEFHKKLSSLRFLDPACGSGNFLTETFKSLRRLEIKTLAALPHVGVGEFMSCPLKVGINQFYGIEINDFAAQVARAALWISDCQMKQEAEEVLNMTIGDTLPLVSDNNNIRREDALTTDWSTVIKPKKLSYIIGNPPFEGSKVLSEDQKASIAVAMSEKDEDGKAVWKSYGTMDFVCAWYAKAAEYMSANKTIRAAFVSTNSITQGEQVALLWKPLVNHYGLKIPFAWRTFVWENDSDNNAQVHCVIISFLLGKKWQSDQCRIFQEKKDTIVCNQINSYLMPAEQIFIDSRSKPLCEVPEIAVGCQTIDNGNYIFTEDQKSIFLQEEPLAASFFKPYYSSDDFLNGQPRFCLWLGDCSPELLAAMPLCLQRVNNVAEFRRNSHRKQTIECADTPTQFSLENKPTKDYLVIPRHSTCNRRFLPMGYLTPDDFSSDANCIIENATNYHFGVLQSRIHMAWVKTVCGRIKSDFRYSGRVVYNNFPWPNVEETLAEKISINAQKILDVRASYPNSSLMQLYNPLTMPADLVRAHRENDKAVFDAYSYLGIKPDMEDEEIALILLRESVRLATPVKKKKAKKKKVKKAAKTISKKREAETLQKKCHFD